MKCHKVKRYIEYYLAYKKGRVNRRSLPFDPFEVDTHLASCKECMEAYHEWELLNRALEKPAEGELPRDLAAAVMKRLSVNSVNKGRNRGGKPAFTLHAINLGQAAVAIAAFVAVLDLALGVCSPDFKLWIFGSGKASAEELALRTAAGTRLIEQVGAFFPKLFAEATGFMMRLLQFFGGGA